MKKIDLGQTITILANVGVIAGIVFLALELQQNNRLLRAQADLSYLDNRLYGRELILADPEVAALWMKVANNEPLSAVEEFRIVMSLERGILVRQWEYTQVLDGSLDEESFKRSLREGSVSRRTPQELRFNRAWQNVRETLRTDFIQYMEEQVLNER